MVGKPIGPIRSTARTEQIPAYSNREEVIHDGRDIERRENPSASGRPRNRRPGGRRHNQETEYT